MQEEKNKTFYDIPGWDGIYQINLHQQVKSVKRYVAHPTVGKQLVKERIIKPQEGDRGYLVVCLSKFGVKKMIGIHKLMALTFIKNINDLPLVRHLNDNKHDNRLENLAYGTCVDNEQDKIKNGNKNSIKGESHSFYGSKGAKNTYTRDGSNRHIASKLILNTQNGVYYYGAKEAAEAIGFKSCEYLRQVLGGRYSNKTYLIYV